MKLVDQYNLDGIDLDYESINFGSRQTRPPSGEVPAARRDPRCAVESRGATTSVTVASRTSAKTRTGGSSTTQRWSEADRVRT